MDNSKKDFEKVTDIKTPDLKSFSVESDKDTISYDEESSQDGFTVIDTSKSKCCILI